MLVYIDLHGIGRKALLKKAGKSYVRARVGGREVELAADSTNLGAPNAGSGSGASSSAVGKS